MLWLTVKLIEGLFNGILALFVLLGYGVRAMWRAVTQPNRP